MRFNNIIHPHVYQKGNHARPFRQLLLLPLALILFGCGSDENENLGTIGYVEGFFGGVAADEPRAALIGRDVLTAGGSAADAATAMYFAMAVTLPSQASLGGGGVCMVFDKESKEVRALEFLARPPAKVSTTADRPSAVPGNIRGFFALHARYGRMPWSQLLADAERLARFDSQVSRAFGQDLNQVQQALMAEPEPRRIFGAASGDRIVTEGDFVQQLDLAAILSNIRVHGPGQIYAGNLARQFTEAVAAAGGTLEVSDLHGYQPIWREPVSVSLGSESAYFPPPPPAGGTVAAQMLAMMLAGDRFEDAPPQERPHLVAEASLRAFADREQSGFYRSLSSSDAQALVAEPYVESLMSNYRPDMHQAPEQLGLTVRSVLENPAAGSLVAVDRDGSAVACSVTLNSLFGTGRIAPGTGVFLAALPGQGGRGGTALGPMLVVDQSRGRFYFAAAASGGVAAPAAMVQVAARNLLAEIELSEAVAGKRVLGGGDPDVVYYEQGTAETLLGGLSQRGHQLVQTSTLGKVNVISCPDGIPTNPDTCKAVTDPRGFGLTATAD